MQVDLWTTHAGMCMGTHINKGMIIYKTTNLITGISYIGKDAQNNPLYLGSGLLLRKAITKHGKQNFKKEILEHCANLENLSEREKYWINFYNADSSPLFYNILEGGSGGDTFTNNPNKEEIRKKNSHPNRMWIKNIETSKIRFIEKDKAYIFLQDGWVRCTSPNRESNSFSTKSTIWIHDPLTRKSKMIKEPALLGFLNLGYVMGRAPRNPEWNLNNKMSQLKRVTRE